jgi:hypothetical protein
MGQSDPSLKGWWTFDDGAGTTAADSSGSGPDIPLVDTTWEEGVVGGAVHFHRAGYGRDTAYSFSGNAITICAWVWHDAFATNQVERYVTVGPEVAVIRRNSDGRLHFYITTAGVFSHIYVAGVLTEGQWHHVAGTWDGLTQRLYLDGVEIDSLTPTGALAAGTMIRLSSPDGEPLNGMLDDARIYNRALSQREIAALMDPVGPARARDPIPADKATDVPSDVTLRWTPGEFAATHDVYFGTTFEDVNEADPADPRGVLVAEGHADARFEQEAALEYDQTYYWRIDEVNAAPDGTVFKGKIWSFAVEPFSYPVTGVAATASGSQTGMGPENTVNGSGLNADDEHSVELTQMWMTDGARPAWIQYEFDKVYKLDKMQVWNSNQLIEAFLGFGAKGVTIESSVDGETWTQLEGVAEFAQATGSPAYRANTTVDFGGTMARFVKLTIDSNWGGVAPQTGLSEVRFFQIPVQAFGPEPAAGATGVRIDTDLNWRPGREAESHEVYLGADPAALTRLDAVTGHRAAPGTLDFATTYFWKVDELGGGLYEGDLWSFTTQEYATIEDMESYNDDDQRIFDTWVDGWVNNTGSQVGYDVSPFAERTIVHGGRQSMPLAYNNEASPFYSEAEREFPQNQDWTAGGADSLSLWVRGVATNSPDTLYVVIEDSTGKTATATHPTAVTSAAWTLWTIPQSDLAGVNMARVRKVYIGVGSRTSPVKGGAGLVYIDDIGYGRPLP